MNLLNELLIVSSILSGVCITSSNTNSFASNDNISSSTLDSFLNESLNAYSVPGFTYSLVNKDEILFSKSYGSCKSNEELFFIGSESKSFTALSIMKLVEENKISLDNDISVYLKDINLGDKVTVRDLLNQTSGFDTYLKQGEAKINYSHYGKFTYANENYDLLGLIIEEVTNSSYGDYVKNNIFNPLGMNSSYASVDEIDKSKFAKAYKNFFGVYIEVEPVFPSKTSWFNVPAGYIASTSKDMNKYLMMYLNDGQGIVSKESIETIFSSRVPAEKEHNSYYAFGWFYVDYFGEPLYFHQGLTETYQSEMFILPSRGVAGELLISSYDQFVNQGSLQDMFFNSIKIVCNKNYDKPDSSAYTKQHILIDLLYFMILVIGISLLVLSILFIKKNKYSIKKNIVILSISSLCLLFVALFPGIISTPLFVISSYVTDLFICLITYMVIFAIDVGFNAGTLIAKSLVKGK